MKFLDMSKKVIIIGSGIAGMAAAIRLALNNFDVSVYESNEHPGGKVFQIKNSNYRFDAGPSLFTLPELLDELFELAEKNRKDYINYFRTPITCKYFFEDKTSIKAFTEVEKFKQEVEKSGISSKYLGNYLKHNRFVFDNISGIFLHKPIHRISTFLTFHTLKALLKLPKYRIFKSVHTVNKHFLKHPKLIQIFDRYVTYGGSNPYKAPGILTLISHLENNLGAYMFEGGMYNLAPALYKLACDVGVKFFFNSKVDKIILDKKNVSGVLINSKEINSDIVISNADVFYTYKNLLSEYNLSNIFLKQPLSLSAVVFYWGIKKKFDDLELHNVFFSENYKEEFDTIFKKKEIYHDPSIYLYISSKVQPGDAPDNHENWYVSVYVPVNTGQDWNTYLTQIRKYILKKISKNLNIDIEPLIDFEKVDDPRIIEKYTSSYKGALYGPNSNKKMSAFLRHPNNSSKIKGLYFCGGTVHPGGGIPLCLLSAKIVSDLIEEKFS